MPSKIYYDCKRYNTENGTNYRPKEYQTLVENKEITPPEPKRKSSRCNRKVYMREYCREYQRARSQYIRERPNMTFDEFRKLKSQNHKIDS